jgi:hypothetical protein
MTTQNVRGRISSLGRMSSDMALSEEAKQSLAGLWGSYDFYLIRDRHFKTASDMVERFLETYQHSWSRAPRPIGAEFAKNPRQVHDLITEWAEKKLTVVTENDSIRTIQANVMFKQLLYGQESINFGSTGTNWKKKTEIAKELRSYKPWSIAHAAATAGGKTRLRKHMESIIKASGSSSEKALFEGWWDLTDEEDRPMLFPQVWGHTSGKLWLLVSKEKTIPAFFSFGLINVLTRTKIVIQCEPRPSQIDADAEKAMMIKRNLAANEGWLVFQFSYDDVRDNLPECFESIEDYLHY